MKLINTEEDIKQKVIMPYLFSLGFNIDELKFEESISIKLGKFSVRIDTNKQIENAAPRLDILVTVNGVNYFVIEAKTDSYDLNNEDKEQVICYARLVHPIAPFSILTNGKQFRIFETISKLEIDNDFDFNGYKISTDIEQAYNEAFEYFIGYSQYNLKQFCKAQSAEGLITLLGSKEDRRKKFVPEVYVNRKDLTKEISEFLNSDKVIFSIYGESGAGKTCEMCGLTLQYQDIHPVLFYRGINIVNGIISHIANDFNWGFSSSYDDVALLKKLSNIVKTPLIIFIDGIDEWTSPSKVEELGYFVSKLKNRKIKVVVSCKTVIWNSFCYKLGSPTQLSEEIYKSMAHQADSEKGYLLSNFTEKEFYGLIKKYRIMYSFDGLFEDLVLEECKRSPFLLRVFFEVAELTSSQHITFSMEEFYTFYYNSLLDHIDYSEKELAKHQLKIIAQLLLEHNIDVVDMSLLRETLQFGPNDTILKSLIDRNILEVSSDAHETYVGFYFQKLRDYIIAFVVKKWHKMSVIQLKQDINKNLNDNNIWYESFKLFYNLTSEENKSVIDFCLRTNAIRYLELYTTILDIHFPYLKTKFAPFTRDHIGFIAEFNMRQNQLWMYGFRSIESDMPQVKFIPVDNNVGARESNMTYLMGASYMHHSSSANGFSDISITKEVVNNEILSQLKKLVKNCDLYEGNNYYLSLEKALGSIESLRLFKNTDNKNIRDIFPISYAAIYEKLRYKHAYSYYENELIDSKRESGEISETWSGTTVSYSVNLSFEDRAYIHDNALKASVGGIDIGNKLDIDSNRYEKLLLEGIETIQKHCDCIDEVILPAKDKQNVSGYNYDYYKAETMMSLIKRLYELYLSEYKSLVESNFNSLKQYFALYDKMPIKLLIGTNFINEKNSIKLYYCNGDNIYTNSVELVDINKVQRGSDSFEVYCGEYKYKAFMISGVSVSSLFSSFGNVSSPFNHSEYTILRNLVYSHLLDEMPSVSDAFRKMYDCYDANYTDLSI